MNSFKDKVEQEIAGIPHGRVVSYSQLALMCGKPSAARQVGQIAHFGPSHLPWHRLVKADGAMARGFVPGGPEHQRDLLLAEGVRFIDGRVIMSEHQL